MPLLTTSSRLPSCSALRDELFGYFPCVVQGLFASSLLKKHVSESISAAVKEELRQFLSSPDAECHEWMKSSVMGQVCFPRQPRQCLRWFVSRYPNRCEDPSLKQRQTTIKNLCSILQVVTSSRIPPSKVSRRSPMLALSPKTHAKTHAGAPSRDRGEGPGGQRRSRSGRLQLDSPVAVVSGTTCRLLCGLGCLAGS